MFHVGQEEMDIYFDIFTINNGYAPINSNYSTKYSNRYLTKKNNTLNIWIGDYRATGRLNALKNGKETELENGVDSLIPINFFIEKKIDQSTSIATSVKEKAKDFVASFGFNLIMYVRYSMLHTVCIMLLMKSNLSKEPILEQYSKLYVQKNLFTIVN